MLSTRTADLYRDLVIPCWKPGKPGRFFTAEQGRSILALASEPWHTIFALAAMTGLRPGEVLGLSIDDLDFEQRLIFVRRSAWYRHLISPKSAVWRRCRCLGRWPKC